MPVLPMHIQMIASGEASGNLALMLEKTANTQYEDIKIKENGDVY